MRQSLAKVPLTVPSFRPSFKPQAGVYLQRCNFVAPLFSWSYKLLFPQLLCFDNHLRCPPGWGSASSQLSDLCSSAFSYPLPRCPLSTFRMNTCKSVSKQRTLTPFRMNTCEKTRGGEVIVNLNQHAPRSMARRSATQCRHSRH